jgi:hypothetical protein
MLALGGVPNKSEVDGFVLNVVTSRTVQQMPNKTFSFA